VYVADAAVFVVLCAVQDVKKFFPGSAVNPEILSTPVEPDAWSYQSAIVTPSTVVGEMAPIENAVE
jgi:hypothetical protein